MLWRHIQNSRLWFFFMSVLVLRPFDNHLFSLLISFVLMDRQGEWFLGRVTKQQVRCASYPHPLHMPAINVEPPPFLSFPDPFPFPFLFYFLLISFAQRSPSMWPFCRSVCPAIWKLHIFFKNTTSVSETQVSVAPSKEEYQFTLRNIFTVADCKGGKEIRKSVFFKKIMIHTVSMNLNDCFCFVRTPIDFLYFLCALTLFYHGLQT